ncbi:hypothetical protein CTI12_AA523060 [Artemisia annua]|uniref:Uncharacterized protein n=1 Tax=Artemisia annua TaxID=35608 RepID=A0A2U1L751_ARTAN|nr:hypothetical protein CTI12_AA523060 [Artemisia annua]
MELLRIDQHLRPVYLVGIVVKIVRMMSSTIRRKALSLCSSALANTAQPSLAGSAARGCSHLFEILKFVEQVLKFNNYGTGMYHHSKQISRPRSGLDLLLHTVCNYLITESAAREPIAQLQNEGNIAETAKKTHNGPAYFTGSGAVIGSVLSAPIVNAPPAAKLGMGSVVTSSFVPSLALFWHINNGMEEILADYVHHEMTRSLVLVMMRLFLIVAAKDVFVATN